MSCPTCEHTMHCVANNPPKPGVFWCPRCGTLKTPGDVPDFERPMIVKRANAVMPHDCTQIGIPLSEPEIRKRYGALAECLPLDAVARAWYLAAWTGADVGVSRVP